MNRNDHLRRNVPRRRQSIVLPKRRHHLSFALIFLILLIGLPLVWAQLFGNDDDAVPKGTVSVATLPEDQIPSPLDRNNSDLPDLLAATVPMGDNPTDSIVTTDALGNPTPSSPAASKPASPKSKTIRLPDPRPAPTPLDPSLTRSSEFGPIPAPNGAGVTPLETYRGADKTDLDSKPVSVIIGGLGINAPLTLRAIDELPPEITLSFAAHAPGLQGWIDKARLAGHEVLLELPMESEAFDAQESGSDRTLRTAASVSDNRRNLHYLLSRAQGYAGVINYNGEAFLRRSDAVSPILTELKASGLGLFIDGAFDAPSLPALSQSLSLPYNTAFGIIDPAPDRALINQQLDTLIAEAKSGSGAVGVGFVYPQTLDAVKGWAATLSDNGLILVPATATLK
jgi:polysaccharide deacetylase 2 family uncharacterized protein YibQ